MGNQTPKYQVTWIRTRGRPAGGRGWSGGRPSAGQFETQESGGMAYHARLALFVLAVTAVAFALAQPMGGIHRDL